MDEKNNVGGYSDRNLNRRMLVGSRFFTRGDYADAAYCFRHARDASIQIYGESSLECAIARYSYGLCLLCQVSIPVNDPMHLVPKEVDYYDYEGSALPFPSSAFRRYTGAMEGKDVKMLEDAKGELILAWSLVEYRIDYYILKANILSALGEVAFRRGELNPQRYYFEALSVFDSLYGENNKRVADMYPSQVWSRISLTITLCVAVYIYIKCPTCDLIDHILASEFRYVKLLICLEGSDKSKAIAFGKKALLLYSNRRSQLFSEMPTVVKLITNVIIRRLNFGRQTDPPIQQKKDEASQLVDIIAKLEIKLDRLEAGTSLSFYREVTSVTQHRYSRRTVKVNTNLVL